MGKAKQFAYNSFWLLVSTVSILLVGAVYRPILGRILGPEELGRYTFIQTFVAYFVVVAYFGVRQVIAREIGRDPQVAKSYLLAACKVRGITTVVAVISCWSTAYALQREPQVTLGIVILSLSIATMAAAELFESVLVARQRSLYVAVGNVVGNLLKLGVGIWILQAGYGLFGVLWVFVSTSALTAFINWYFVRKVILSEKQRDAGPGRIKYICKEATPFFVLNITTKLYGKNDILFLNIIRGNVVTGLYSAAYVFVDLMINVSNNCAIAAYPIVSKLHCDGELEKGTVELSKAYERLHKHMLMFSLSGATLIMSVGGSFLKLIFGSQYDKATSYLQVLAWAPPVDISIVISGIFLCAVYRQGLVAKIEIVMMILSIVLTVSLILIYGAIGAAIATVAAALVNAIVRFLYIWKYIGAVSILSTWGKPLICALMMIVAVVMTSELSWTWRLLSWGLSLITSIILVRPYDSEDRRLILSVLKRR